MRHVTAIVIGYALWTAIWLGGGAVLGGMFPDQAEGFAQGVAITSVGYLLSSLVLSVVCSYLAGVVTAAIARERTKRAVGIMAGLLLATGIFVQAGAWSLMPVWYHLIFLALLVPVSLAGGQRRQA